MDESVQNIFKIYQFDYRWFNAGRKIIESYLKKYLDNTSLDILDIGIGYGSLIKSLRQFGLFDVIEPYIPATEYRKDIDVEGVY